MNEQPTRCHGEIHSIPQSGHAIIASKWAAMLHIGFLGITLNQTDGTAAKLDYRRAGMNAMSAWEAGGYRS